MQTGRPPVYFPVDHRANFSGYQTPAEASEKDIRPWPVRRRVGVFIAIAVASWIVMLSPLLLID